MKLPLRPSLSPPVVFRILCLVGLIGWSGYQQLQIFHLNTEIATTANRDSINAVTQRLNGLDDRIDAVGKLKPVTEEDFRAGQQALSNRIDAVQALVRQIQQDTQTAAHSAASMQEVITLEAKFEGLQTNIQELVAAKTTVKPPIAPLKPKLATQARKGGPLVKPIESAPPFSVIGVEYRGGERFLAVAPLGSTQLSQLYLVRPGDTIGGSNWKLSGLDDTHAQFNINGAPRTLSLQQ